MTEVVLKNNYFEFGNKINQQISITRVLFTNGFETKFLEGQYLKSLVWLRYFDIFFFWTHGEENP